MDLIVNLCHRGTNLTLEAHSLAPLLLGVFAVKIYVLTCNIKGTASFKMCEIDPFNLKETSFTSSLVIN